MVICKTPFRISFFGGGTDHPKWYREHGGEVLSSSIDKYCYLSCRYLPPFFEHKYRIVYSKIDMAETIDQIGHPAARAVLQYMNLSRGLEIHHDGDLPARSGMGTSSSFTVGLIHALYAIQGKMPAKELLAKDSIYVEQELLKESVGSQDQVSAAYGGLNHIKFMQNGEISVQPMTITRERVAEFNSHLMLFYTGIKRTSSEIAETFVNSIGVNRHNFRVIKDLVHEGISLLGGNGDLKNFGELLHEGWQFKRSLSAQVSNPVVDDLYAAARSAGAIGGKLAGAGGGGFLLLFVPPERQAAVREKLKDLILVSFKFEFSGSQVIFFYPQSEQNSEEMLWRERNKPQFYEASSLTNRKDATV